MSKIFIVSGILATVIVGVFWLVTSEESKIKKSEEDSIGVNVTVFMIMTFIVSLFIALIISLLCLFDSSSETKYQSTDIYYEIGNLSLNSSTQGNFFVGTRQINQVEYYYFYLKDGNKYKLTKIQAEGTDVIEDDNPKLEVKTTVQLTREVPGSIRKFFNNSKVGEWHNKDEGSIFSGNNEQKVYILHIPKGSINQTYNLQLNSK
jgi:hypothetical protein